MRKPVSLLVASFFLCSVAVIAQTKEKMVEAMVKEATENSHLESLAHELLDQIGPRLIGTPQMNQAHDWAVSKFQSWGIDAHNEQYGQWKGWERGITHIDMVSPRVVSLEGRQLAWSPATPKKGVQAEVIVLPEVANAAEFAKWLPTVKGKIVLISMHQPSGRPEYNWKEFATEESLAKMKEDKDAATKAWEKRIENTGYNSRTLPEVLENNGAVAIFQSYWSQGFGVNKVFSARTKKVPTIDISLEDYGMLYRLAESGSKPQIKLTAESKHTGMSPAFNTIAEIKGTETPEEYIILSAHFDSWDGGTGATDNGTGTIVMMEAARILKKLYPNPKRTIIVGLWGGEEQGLNGSRAYVKDHPEVVNNMQALFNQDNGTGRVVNINGQGFLHSYEFITRWLQAVPVDIRKHIETTFPGIPGTGGSDFASFVAAGAPGFSLSSLNWSYGNYTWHTNRDTYDKIIFDDVRNNAILTAILTYMASEDPETFPRDRAVLPISPRTGEQIKWPEPRDANRTGEY